MTDLTKKCVVCGKEFAKPYYTGLPEWRTRKFCSKSCVNKERPSWNKGLPWTEDFRRRIVAIKKGKHYSPKTEFKAGNPAWNNGLKGTDYLSKKARQKMAVWKDKKGKAVPAWKGMKAGYHAKHVYLVKWHGHPKKCEHCGVKGEYIFSGSNRRRWSIDWANRTGVWSRDVKDYFGLCRTCHNRFDQGK